MHWLVDPQAWMALATLTVLEIVLGIDNIVFITILVGRLPQSQRNQGRIIGLGLAMCSRILLLLSLTWVMGLTESIITIMGNELSGRDLILLGGGLFLLGKSTHEIHTNLEGDAEAHTPSRQVSFFGVLVQIALLDIVFSLDSVITAVGLAQHLTIMVLAIVLSVGVMMLSAQQIGTFVDTHPTIKMLALSFLLLIGFTLIGEGLDMHVSKGAVYFAMAFSTGVEMLNISMRKKRTPVTLYKSPTMRRP